MHISSATLTIVGASIHITPIPPGLAQRLDIGIGIHPAMYGNHLTQCCIHILAMRWASPQT